MTNKPQFVGEKVRVSDVFDLRMGKTPSRKNLSYWHDGNHDWISIADLGSFGKYVGSTKERINDLAITETGIKPAPANTVLMSFKLSLGKTAITTIPVYTNEAIMAFVDKGVYPVDPSFMYHQCRAKDWTADTNTAVMGKTLNKKTLGQQMVFLPGLAEQKAIARQLDFVERQLVNANEQLEQLDSLVKSRFVEMFGDPISNSKGLETQPGSALFKIVNGKTKPMDERYETGFPAYGGNGVSWYSLDSLVDFPTIVVGRVGRHCGNARLVNDPCWVTDNAMYIKRFHSNELDLIYLDELMRVVGFNRYADRGDLWKITQQPFMEFNYPMPPLAQQQEFAASVRQVDKSRFVAQQQIEKLQMLYDSLAQEYFGD